MGQRRSIFHKYQWPDTNKSLSKADGYVATTAKDPEEGHRSPSVGGAAGCPPASILPFFYVIQGFLVVAMADLGNVLEAQRRKLCVVA